MSSPSSTKVIKIGVFVPGDAQLLDLACVDVFHMMSREYLSLLPMLPAHIPALAPSVEIYYITSDPKNNNNTAATEDDKTETEGKKDIMIPLTSNLTIKSTHVITSPEVAPGKLNILLVPGPDPSSTFDEATLKFLRSHAEAANHGTDILSVCTGIFLCGAAGLLDNGRTACGPRGIQDIIKKKHPGVKLVGEKLRWVKDGNLWTSGESSTS
jgi:putative intracellular protease/amidase